MLINYKFKQIKQLFCDIKENVTAKIIVFVGQVIRLTARKQIHFRHAETTL